MSVHKTIVSVLAVPKTSSPHDAHFENSTTPSVVALGPRVFLAGCAFYNQSLHGGPVTTYFLCPVCLSQAQMVVLRTPAEGTQNS